MVKPRAAGEFALIDRYFRPLAAGHAGAFALGDDAAVMDPVTDGRLVATTDTLVAGVHFLAGDPPDLIARKLLRVNLSDLAAMGARPLTYLLSLAVPEDISAGWIEAFARGLGVDQAAFGVVLIGGDTVATPGPVTLTLTAFGTVPAGEELRRAGAKAGDTVFVSGTIGDAALGLAALRGGLAALEGRLRDHVVGRYRLPCPRIELGLRLRGLAHAAIDISDGLVGDLGHVCDASGVGAVIEWPRVPLSEAACAAVAGDPALREAVLGGGDDYELLFTVAAEAEGEVAALAGDVGLALAAVGRVTDPGGVIIRDADGGEIAIARAGYSHF